MISVYMLYILQMGISFAALQMGISFAALQIPKYSCVNSVNSENSYVIISKILQLKE